MRKWVVGEKITRRADCANKRRIYKFGLRICESCDVGEKLRCAQIAQIRGGFINWDGVCESCDVGEKLQDAQIAQIRGGFINWDGVCESGCVGCNYAKCQLRK